MEISAILPTGQVSEEKKFTRAVFRKQTYFFSASAGVSENLSGEQSRKRRIPVKTDRVAGIELASVGKWAGYFPD